MSFSGETKEELIRQPMDKPCCMLSELSALTQTTGSLGFQGAGRFSVTYKVESAALARRIYTMLRRALDASPQLHFVQHTRLGGRTVSVLTLDGGDAARLLIAMNMMREEPDGTLSLIRTVPKLDITRQCCRRAFLRGAFLGAGSITNPEKGYHMEIVAEDESLSRLIERFMEKSGVAGKHTTRRGKSVVYLKSAQGVADMLALMGAPSKLMELENIRITSQVRGNINRASNCDDHNDELIAASSDGQMRDITLIAIHRGLASLPEGLRAVAQARLDNSELSMQALGQLLDPPLSKSGINHRMQKLSAIAREIERAHEAESLAYPPDPAADASPVRTQSGDG